MKVPPPVLPILLASILGSGVFLLLSTQTSEVAQTAGNINPTVFSAAVAPDETDTSWNIASSTPVPKGYVQYRNQVHHFSLSHPSTFDIHEYEEGGGAITITLENVATAHGLQIFVVPYTETTISEARFKQDVPSGARSNVQNAMLGGVRAVSFNSHDSMFGDTREIWAIHDGYLYEITAVTYDADWFDPIISTWKFI